MTPDQIEALFTRSDGTYAFARWGRPIAPIVFGVQDETLSVVKGAWEAVATLAKSYERHRRLLDILPQLEAALRG